MKTIKDKIFSGKSHEFAIFIKYTRTFFAAVAVVSLTLGINANEGECEDPEGFLQEFSKSLAKVEKFEVFKKAYYEGEAFFSEEDEELRKEYAGLYREINLAMVEDRIDETVAKKIKSALRKLGVKASQKSRGNGGELNDDDAVEIKEELDELKTTFEEKVIAKTPLSVHTPILNEGQLAMDEIVEYSLVSGAMPAGITASIKNKLEKLEKEEDGYKNDRSISDSERERLLKKAVKIAEKVGNEFFE